MDVKMEDKLIEENIKKLDKSEFSSLRNLLGALTGIQIPKLSKFQASLHEKMKSAIGRLEGATQDYLGLRNFGASLINVSDYDERFKKILEQAHIVKPLVRKVNPEYTHEGLIEKQSESQVSLHKEMESATKRLEEAVQYYFNLKELALSLIDTSKYEKRSLEILRKAQSTGPIVGGVKAEYLFGCYDQLEKLGLECEQRHQERTIRIQKIQEEGRKISFDKTSFYRMDKRARKGLKEMGIKTLGDLANKTEKELKDRDNVRWLGYTGIKEIRRVLQKHHLDIKEPWGT